MSHNTILQEQLECPRRRKKGNKNSFSARDPIDIVQVYSKQMENLQPPPLVPKEQDLSKIQPPPQPQEQQSVAKEEEKELEPKAKVKRDNKNLTGKDLEIRQLLKCNKMITRQVQAVWQKLKEEIPHDKKRTKLISNDDSYEKMQKDLKNAQQWMKIAEKQLTKYKQRQKASKKLIQNMRKYKQQISEKQAMAIRLRSEIVVKTKQLKQKQKVLQNKIMPTSDVNQTKMKTQEANHLYQMLKQAEKKEEERANNLKKQYGLVKKLQKQLVEKGISEAELQQMKKKCIIQIPNRSQIQKNKSMTIQLQPIKKPPPKQERTKKRMTQMNLQIKLLEKKQEEFNNQYSNFQLEWSKYNYQNIQIKTKIKESQQEINRIQELNQKLRTKHIAQHRRKIRLKSLQNQRIQKQKQQLKKNKRQMIVQQHKNRTRGRRIKSVPNQKSFMTQIVVETLEPFLAKQTNDSQNIQTKQRNCEFGQFSQNGTKFNDKYVLEKDHQGKKIIGVEVYLQPEGQFISGLSFTYESGIKGGDYVLKNEENSQLYKIQKIDTDQHYIKDIYAQFAKAEQKTQLIGLQLQLSNGQHRKVGTIQKYEQKLSQNEYVSNISGGMRLTTKGETNISIIEALGMDIYQL